MRVYSFPRGGLSFEDPTVPPKSTSVLAFLPTFSVIPLSQYPGEHVPSLVSVGDTVQEGMLIYCVSGLYLLGFIADRVNLNVNINRRIDVFLKWIIEGLRIQEGQVR